MNRALLAPATALLAAAVLAACGDGRPDRPAGAASDPRDQRIARFLDATVPRGASGSVVVARDGEMVHCEGFGLADREARVAAGCDTVYDVGSITKQFTAAAILKLEMMGELEVTDRIGEHLGRVPRAKRRITLHQLLTHTSGLVEGLGDDYERQTRASVLSAALDSRLHARPGAEYAYSNVGYSVLAAIVERASGMGYEQFLARHLFAPARMTQTGYVLPGWRPDRVAVEYGPAGRPQGRPFDHPWADDGPFWNLRGNGGLLSTARDMFRWHVALEGDEVLDRRAKRKLFEPHVLEEPGGRSSYGYGWVILRSPEGRIAWHNGGNGWSYGEVLRLPGKGAMVFWITNQTKDRRRGWSVRGFGPALTEGLADRALDGR
ncbi:MAG TPA: serine hydrolase domain-containing protein [Capillimicrobium sp.]|jgi:CubicO group peptidase (beta-lactamase class C family)